MSDLTLTRIIAPNRLTCFQCTNIGLPIDGIEVGDTCVEIKDEHKHIRFACEDCFERLNLEIESLASDDMDKNESGE